MSDLAALQRLPAAPGPRSERCEPPSGRCVFYAPVSTGTCPQRVGQLSLDPSPGDGRPGTTGARALSRSDVRPNRRSREGQSHGVS